MRAKALQRAGVNFPCIPPQRDRIYLVSRTFGLYCVVPTCLPAGRLARRLRLVCGFCPSARTFALRLPSDPSSRRRPCLRLVLLIVFINLNTIGSRTGDFHPISSRPCRAYTNHSSGWLTATADLCRWATRRKESMIIKYTSNVNANSSEVYECETT